MRAFIPEIGSKLTLEKDWTFELYQEYRNKHIFIADGRKEDRNWREPMKSYQRTLPAGSVVMVDRIYVRQGAKDFSSVTLYLLETTDKVLTKQGKRTQPFKAKGAKHFGRFWVKLDDFNGADFLVTMDATKPKNTTPQCGDPITLGQFKKKKNAHWWVKFVHEDPDLCFDSQIHSRLLETLYSYDRHRADLVAEGYTEKSEQRRGWDNKLETNYWYLPPHFLRTLVPESWREAHNSPEFQVKEDDPMSRVFTQGAFKKVTVVRHPLEKQLHIPREKKDRIPMGLLNDKALMEDVKVAGGLLTVCMIEEK